MTEMKRSWLVQRLERPSGGFFGAKDNPFSFGGGYKNGGLTDEAMDLLRGVFSFDYMGAAEFEFGAVPEALSSIVHNVKKYQAFSFTFPLADVAGHWKDESKVAPEGDATIYVICHKDHVDEVQTRIKEWAGPTRDDLKESTRLANALRPDERDTDRCGWLELNNAFFFFSDEEMWQNTARLFGIET